MKYTSSELHIILYEVRTESSVAGFVLDIISRECQREDSLVKIKTHQHGIQIICSSYSRAWDYKG